ncbi:hypothetical protein RND71_003390 [Anisodus tanguticus]|uniref:Uncharacterized protein n=1 Tax=Anisodus tanguticus TaxID=243964 RepID=A0AAE1VWM5_9SOLA|nr:hypothetical protein RND71_003390 [Anisodus tanguticus]
MGSLSMLYMGELSMAMDVQSLENKFVRLDISEPGKVLACVEAQSSLLEQIRSQLFDNVQLCKICDKVLQGDA